MSSGNGEDRIDTDSNESLDISRFRFVLSCVEAFGSEDLGLAAWFNLQFDLFVSVSVNR